MERTALARPSVQPLPRAARKSEWLRSALAHHHWPDPGVENEIVVLATGIDQYLQEVFHHLAYPNRDDTVSAEDFAALCAVLGLTGDVEEFVDVCSGLPCQLSFKDFHSRLCGYFRVRNARKGTAECAWRMPVTEDTELVERQIRLRWPRTRRRKCVTFDLTRNQSESVNRSIKGRTTEEEATALRELVEDLRSALQGSDARCLALEVALKRERKRTLPSPSRFNSSVSTPATRREIRDPLLRELKLIRSSRDGQLEEAMKYNERMEEELQWAYQKVHKLQGVESALRKENAQIRRRAEEAREALSLGLQRVRQIQEQAQCVPQLQSRIIQLETKLHQYEECLQRSVEGRAASDEEEEDRGRREGGQCCVLEGKQHISQLHGCGTGLVNISQAHTHLYILIYPNVSRSAMGKIVMDTLDVCSRSGDGMLV
uniref:EF-hand and coiled-coil domain containing 1 n=1 Tax=Mastacembelus armatus TaxID=205130 RepID=A0A3Q3NEL5_9TELE